VFSNFTLILCLGIAIFSQSNENRVHPLNTRLAKSTIKEIIKKYIHMNIYIIISFLIYLFTYLIVYLYSYTSTYKFIYLFKFTSLVSGSQKLRKVPIALGKYFY
jgi:hypothetical protein